MQELTVNLPNNPRLRGMSHHPPVESPDVQKPPECISVNSPHQPSVEFPDAERPYFTSVQFTPFYQLGRRADLRDDTDRNDTF